MGLNVPAKLVPVQNVNMLQQCCFIVPGTEPFKIITVPYNGPAILFFDVCFCFRNDINQFEILSQTEKCAWSRKKGPSLAQYASNASKRNSVFQNF
jgi:hypothetical protein